MMKKRLFVLFMTTFLVAFGTSAFASTSSVTTGSGAANMVNTGAWGNGAYSWTDVGTVTKSDVTNGTSGPNSGFATSNFAGTGWSNSSAINAGARGWTNMALGGSALVDGAGFAFVDRNPNSDFSISGTTTGSSAYESYGLGYGTTTANWGMGSTQLDNYGMMNANNGSGNGNTSFNGYHTTFAYSFSEGPNSAAEAGSRGYVQGTSTTIRHY